MVPGVAVIVAVSVRSFCLPRFVPHFETRRRYDMRSELIHAVPVRLHISHQEILAWPNEVTCNVFEHPARCSCKLYMDRRRYNYLALS